MSYSNIKAARTTEAQVRAETIIAQAQDGYRIEPTPEDMAIHARTVKRLLRWCTAQNAKAPRSVIGPTLAGITRRAIGDALHFGPAPAVDREAS